MELVSQAEMLSRGGGGHLSKAFERYIPLSKIEGLEPPPAASDEIGYVKGREILVPIEVMYSADEDAYYLYAGNHRYQQAVLNEDTHILAWIQPDKGLVGTSATRDPLEAGMSNQMPQPMKDLKP